MPTSNGHRLDVRRSPRPLANGEPAQSIASHPKYASGGFAVVARIGMQLLWMLARTPWLAGHAIGGRRIKRSAVKVVLADQAKGQLVGHRLADARRPRRQQLLDAHRMHGRRRMRVASGRIATARLSTGNVNDVLDRDPQAGQRSIGRPTKRKCFDKRPALFEGDCRRFCHGAILG